MYIYIIFKIVPNVKITIPCIYFIEKLIYRQVKGL